MTTLTIYVFAEVFVGKGALAMAAVSKVLSGLLLTLVLSGMAQAQGRAASVVTEVVALGPISDTTPVIGQLVASVQAEVATRRAGIAGEVLFVIGDTVTKGDLLVRLETEQIEIEKRSAEASLETARAGVATAEASLALAIQGLNRQTKLQNSTAFSRAQFEDLQQEAARARGELARAVAQVGMAEASMSMMAFNLNNTEIIAPFTGVVTERIAQPGQYLRVGDPVARLLDADRLEIEAQTPTELTSGLPPGKEVNVLFGSDVSATATVRAILPIETIATRTRPVRFTADLSGVDPLRIAVGKSVSLQIPVSAPREAILAAKDALVQARGGGWSIFVVEDGKANPRPVTLGVSAGGQIEILSGLDVGDEIVVRGNERLRPGQDVAPRGSGG